MNQLLKQNLTHLAAIDPILAARVENSRPPAEAKIIPSRSGPPTLILKGISFHSRMDPWAEARKTAESSSIPRNGKNLVVFGLGLGYHVLVLAEKFDRITVIEPDPGLIRLAFSHLDFTAVMGRLTLLVNRAGRLDLPEAFLWPHAPTVRIRPEDFEYWTVGLKTGQPVEKTGPEHETAGQLLQKVNSIQGLSRLLGSFAPDEQVTMAELARAVRQKTGPMSQAEIIGLLLGELAE